MSERSNFGLLLLATSSFIGGIAAGILMAPKSGKENRDWVTDSATELANWVDDRGRTLVDTGEIRYQKLRENVQREIDRNFPDLYKATEDLRLDT